MSSSITKNIKLTLFGESHGPMIGITIEGLKPGIELNLEYINNELDKRRAYGSISTPRQEKDQFEIVSGYFNGFTTGTPLTIIVKNENTHSSDYKPNILRPGHADYTAFLKYNGYQDYRGGGHFSGRMTVGIVIAGAICKQILENKGIIIGKNGRKLKGIGKSAREDMELLLGSKVNLQLWVKVKENWRNSQNYISDFGYNDK